jgi:hypothetical protein
MEGGQIAMAISSKVRQAKKPKRKKERKQALEEARPGVPMQMEITRQRLAKLLDEIPMGFGRAKAMHEALNIQEKSGYTWRQILGMDPP